MGSTQIKRMAKELDEMTRSVTSDEADLLEEVLRKLKSGKTIAPADAEAIQKMHDRYLAPREEVAVSEESEEIDEEDLEE